MTVQNPAVFLQSEAHPAEDVRRMFGAMAGASGGIVAASDLEVTETSGAPSMGVDVAGGQVWIPGSEATYQGVYFAENRGVESLTIGASDPTNGRYDLIVAKVEDSAYSGSVNAWSLVVVAGTADPSPVDPATPANSVTLARVTVGAGVSTITDANITDLRTFADGSPAYAADSLATYADSTARTSAVPSPSEGDISYLADTDTVEVYDGSAWAAVGTSGLVHIGRTTIGTAVSSVTVSGAFSSDYDKYRVIVEGVVTSANIDFGARLGAVTTGYKFARTRTNMAGSTSGGGSTSHGYLLIGAVADSAGYASAIAFDLYAPNLARATVATSATSYGHPTVGSIDVYAAWEPSTTQHTDITILPVGGTMTGGTIDVYGYRKA